MLHLVESLAASAVASELFPTTSMHTLLITDNEQFHHDDNVLLFHTIRKIENLHLSTELFQVRTTVKFVARKKLVRQ